MRTIVVAAAVVLAACGCGSTTTKANGPIYAWGPSGALYAMQPDGSALHKVAPLPRSGYGPLRVGDWILYNHAVPVTTPKASYYRFELWKMRSDGRNRQLVARNVTLDALSPDGKTIAYSGDSCVLKGYDARCDAENPMELYTIGIDGTHRRRLTHNSGYDGDPSWSPDGTFIAYATDTETRIIRRDGSDGRRLTSGDFSDLAVWSPRRDRLLIAPFGKPWRVVSTNGKVLSVLRPGPPGPKWRPVWSPDGRQIAYVAKRARKWTGEDPLQVWVMNADGTDRHPITRTFGWGIASWAPAS